MKSNVIYVMLLCMLPMMIKTSGEEGEKPTVERIPRSTMQDLPYVVAGKLVYISGQLPREKGKATLMGRVGGEINIAQGRKAAGLCAQAIIEQLKAAVNGNLQKVKRCVKLTGYVSAASEFIQHAIILDGASDLIVSTFGERGRHARTVVGVASLPGDSCVEVEAIFELW